MSDLYQAPDYRALWRTVADNAGDIAPVNALKDWMDECECSPHELTSVGVQVPFLWLDIYRFVGSGRGSGIGRGSGSGSGRGDGIGRGSGSGSGELNTGPYGVHQLEIGKCYLLHCGDWHTFVGRLSAQVGPLTYRFTSVSKIRETNSTKRGGDIWEDLCAGDIEARKACSYSHSKLPATMPLSIVAFDWAGNTPQEDGISGV